MPQIVIRNAVLADAPAIARLSDVLGYPATPEEVRTRLQLIMESEDNCVLVACATGGSVVAWTHVFVAHRLEADSFAELGGLVVAEHERGQGVATKLVKAAEEWAIVHPVGRMRIRSRSTRAAAHAFYQNVGYVRVKRQEVFEKMLKSREMEP